MASLDRSKTFDEDQRRIIEDYRQVFLEENRCFAWMGGSINVREDTDLALTFRKFLQSGYMKQLETRLPETRSYRPTVAFYDLLRGTD